MSWLSKIFGFRQKAFSSYEFFRQLVQSGSITNEYENQPWVYAAVNKIVSNIVGVDWEIIDKSENPDETWEHLFKNPNPMQNYTQFMTFILSNLELYGEIYIYLPDRTKISTIPTTMVPVISSNVRQKIENDKLVAYYFNNKEVPLYQGIRLYYANPYNFNEALAPISAAQMGIAQDYKASQYNLAFFENGAFPGAVLESEQSLTEEEYKILRDQWNDIHRGQSKSFKIGILSGGMKFHAIDIPHKEADFLNQKEKNMEEILAVLGVHKSLIGKTDSINYATFQGVMRMFWQQTELPKMQLFEASINALLLDYYGLEFRFKTETIADLQDTYSERLLWAKGLAELGYPINMINDKLELGMDIVPWGNEAYIPMNVVPATYFVENPTLAIEQQQQQQAPQQTTQEQTTQSQIQAEVAKQLQLMKKKIPSGLSERQRRRYWVAKSKLIIKYEQDILIEMKNVLSKQKAKIMEGLEVTNQDDVVPAEKYTALKNKIKKNADEFTNSLIKYENIILPDVFKMAGKEMDIKYKAIEINMNWEVDPLILKYWKEKGNSFNSINDTLFSIFYNEIEESLKNKETYGQLVTRMREAYQGYSNHIPTIARTEIGQLYGFADYASKEKIGIEYHQWVTSHDEFVRGNDPEDEANHVVLDGEVVKVGDKFSNGLLYPSDLNGPPAEIENCRCVAVAIRQEDINE